MDEMDEDARAYLEAAEANLKWRIKNEKNAIKQLQKELDDRGYVCRKDCDKCKWYIERGTYDDVKFQCGLVQIREQMDLHKNALKTLTKGLRRLNRKEI